MLVSGNSVMDYRAAAFEDVKAKIGILLDLRRFLSF
jgi:hypothetical protein